MSDCVTTTQLAQSGPSPAEAAHQLTRSGDGKMRVDTGNISVITDPASQHTILLDHVKKEATSLSTPQMPQPPGMQMPGMPQIAPPGLPAGVPALPASNVQDLGKRMIDGEEAEGKRITFQPPQMPGMPNVPGMPGMPPLPQKPGMPGAPQLPKPPLSPTVAEVWTNPNLHLPVLTQVKGDFGQQTCKCKNKAIPEPNPSLFQIPADYKDLTKAPKLPAAPIPKI
jgi:hypothetical protein